MIKDLITVKPETSLEEAIEILRKNSIRHLPVVKEEKFFGLVTEGDIRKALFSPFLKELTVSDIMIKNPITITPETSLEEAAILIYSYKIGGLPVLKDKKLVGIITVTDILFAFIEIMGILKSSSRIDLAIEKGMKNFEKAINLIKKAGGEIISVSMGGELKEKKKIYYFRLMKCDPDRIAKELEKNGFNVLSIIK